MITYNPSYPKDFIDSLIGKAKAEEIQNLGVDETHRVFDLCARGKFCFDAFRNLVFNGLTMNDIYPVEQPSLFEVLL
jgi:hypothetical protein